MIFMLVNRYYVIYVEVPSGYPGVEFIETAMWLRPADYRGLDRKEQIRQEFFEAYGRAVLDILEVRR